MADKVHCIRKTLRLMPQEAKVLSDKAKANGMNEAEYIRLLISQKPNDYPEGRDVYKRQIISKRHRHHMLISETVNMFTASISMYYQKHRQRYHSVRHL